MSMISVYLVLDNEINRNGPLGAVGGDVWFGGKEESRLAVADVLKNRFSTIIKHPD